jgi:hypothetical protein
MPPPQITEEVTRTLTGLASGQRAVLDGLLGVAPGAAEDGPLDRRTVALVGVAALVAADGAAPEHHAQVRAALDAGASADDIVGVLAAVAPFVGTSRIVTAAAAISEALGIGRAEPGTVTPLRPPQDTRGR